MKRKVHPEQLTLPIVGELGRAAAHFTTWHDKRLISETNWLFNITETARKDYERNMPMKAALEEIAAIKHSRWGKLHGENYSVAQARATVKFLNEFTANQRERVRLLNKYCAELNERGFETSQIDQLIKAEGR